MAMQMRQAPYRLERVDCNNLVSRVVESFAGAISNREAHVLIHDLPSLCADATAVEVVFANLLGNALNYLDCERLGVIEIGCSATTAGGETQNGSFQTCYVRDNGCPPRVRSIISQYCRHFQLGRRT